MNAPQSFQSWYNGSPKEKLSEAKRLFAVLHQQQKVDGPLLLEIRSLNSNCQLLGQQMTDMELGRLCSGCAARPGGGCCSAYMADNTDTIQMLINLLLGQSIEQREPADTDCCFLGPCGCQFMAKPIFCLNYNCSHIMNGSSAESLVRLERLSGRVLSQQTRIESMLLERLRPGSI